jgi:hypothetical protein
VGELEDGVNADHLGLAGTLAIINAEVLAGATICELFNPGSPVIYGSVASIMDMRTGAPAMPQLNALDPPQQLPVHLTTFSITSCFNLHSFFNFGYTCSNVGPSSTVTMQSWHYPIAQKTPRGSFFLKLFLNT